MKEITNEKLAQHPAHWFICLAVVTITYNLTDSKEPKSLVGGRGKRVCVSVRKD